MLESQTNDLIRQAEVRAMQEVEKLSNVHEGLVTKGQITERIREINESIAGYDLVVESETFRKLAAITGEDLPRLNDRLIKILKLFYRAIEDDDEDSFKVVAKSATYLFNWDEKLKSRVAANLSDLEKYAGNEDINTIREFTLKMVKKYKFCNDLYKSAMDSSEVDNSDIRNNFFFTIPFIREIGPLISIYDSLCCEVDKDKARVDVTLGALGYLLDHFEIEHIYIVDLIPTLLRAIVREEGKNEQEILQMDTNSIVNIAKQSEVGEVLINLSAALSQRDRDIITNSRIGLRLFTKLESSGFWDKITYLPKLAMLEHIARESNRPAGAHQAKDKNIMRNAGRLSDFLYNSNNDSH